MCRRQDDTRGDPYTPTHHTTTRTRGGCRHKEGKLVPLSGCATGNQLTTLMMIMMMAMMTPVVDSSSNAATTSMERRRRRIITILCHGKRAAAAAATATGDGNHHDNNERCPHPHHHCGTSHSPLLLAPLDNFFPCLFCHDGSSRSCD